ncbi:MAG: hypothetical protein IT385_22325 [Deltaproteobacteria bacterium]|nr:hypothetical protein [Deltaproteobacteria bacterium]
MPLPSLAPTDRFIAIWQALGPDPIGRARDLLGERARGLTVALVRGYLGNYMRGNLVPARDALRAAGVDAFIAGNRAGATVADNARRVARAIVKRLDRSGDGRTLVLGGHSKGGLECLRALVDTPRIAERARAVLLSQTPRGPSAVLESLLLREHQASLGRRRRWAERAQRLGITLLRARRGGLELTRRHLPSVVADLDDALAEHGAGVPIIQTASWSTRPTVWLDSFHERLGEIRPGAAHDGQFYLEDLIWPGRDHVLLPHLDHAQPVMDGYGFDSARYWLALVVLVTCG